MIFDKILNIFKKKNSLKAVFHDETGREYSKNVTYTNNKFDTKINGESHTYIVDKNRVYHDLKNEPLSHYYTNNPDPILLDHTRHAEIDSTSFRNIMESKAITDLFAEEGKKILDILLILVIANIIIGLIGLGVLFKLIKVA